jgi:hypothetical protein
MVAVADGLHRTGVRISCNASCLQGVVFILNKLFDGLVL